MSMIHIPIHWLKNINFPAILTIKRGGKYTEKTFALNMYCFYWQFFLTISSFAIKYPLLGTLPTAR